MSEGSKAELIQLAASTGLNIDRNVLEYLLDLISLGAQPKHIADHLRLVCSKASSATSKPAPVGYSQLGAAAAAGQH